MHCGSPGAAWESDRQKWRRLAQEWETEARHLAAVARDVTTWMPADDNCGSEWGSRLAALDSAVAAFFHVRGE